MGIANLPALFFCASVRCLFELDDADRAALIALLN